MSFESGWSLDFCLSCDNQTSEGAYCSQTCRLADLDKAQNNFPDQWHSHSPSRPSILTTLPSNSPPNSTGFVLPPPFDFTFSRKDYRASSPTLAQGISGIFSAVQSQRWSLSSDNFAPLKTTSSRSSMSLDFNIPNGATSSPSQYILQLSDDARRQLQRYDNSFDMTRHRKHRSLS